MTLPLRDQVCQPFCERVIQTDLSNVGWWQAVNGEVFDVVVDMRKNSPTFGQWVGSYLNDVNKQMLWVPPGFAHGFYILSETAEFQYKCTDYYTPDDEYALLWNDPEIGIQWPLCVESPILSAKDLKARPFRECPVFESESIGCPDLTG